MEFRLGKLAVKKDRRTIKMSSILRALPPVPDSYDVDTALGGLTENNKFANDQFGDCVIAGRAHMTLRFEKFEQGKLITINDTDVVNEYFKESGGQDTGLIMLDSLNSWRRGWTIGNKTYNIYAYGILNSGNIDEVKSTIYLLSGAYTGFALPQSAKAQFDSRQIWDVTNGPEAEPGSWGGHCVYIKRYEKALTSTNFTAITWGVEQEMSQDFLLKYCDEAYGIVDDINKWADPANDPLDVQKLNGYLQEILGDQPLSITSMRLPDGTIGVQYTGFLSATGGKPPYIWSIYSGTLPDGLLMDSVSGVISGIPTTVGRNGLVFLCTDSASNMIGIAITIAVNTPTPEPPPGPIPTPPTPSPCKFGNGIAKAMNIGPALLGRKGRFHYLNPGSEQ